jgi:2-polyprenyl-3-methyl-5-hydroxy-6-metoxy-1,4-benzoquinol methylase
MAEFSFSKISPEAIRQTVWEAAQHPQVTEAAEASIPGLDEMETPLPVTKAKSLLAQAREKSPPSGWRYFSRVLRRQPRVNALIFRVLSELIKISRRSNNLIERLRSQLDLNHLHSISEQARLREMVAEAQKVSSERLALSEKEWSKVQGEQRAELTRFKEALAAGEADHRKQLDSLARTIAENQAKVLGQLRDDWAKEVLSMFQKQEEGLQEQHAQLIALMKQSEKKNEALAGEFARFEKHFLLELDEMRAHVQRADRSLRELRKPGRPTAKKNAAATKNVSEDRDSDFDYFMFEQRFRGSTESIRKRQSHYVDVFRDADNVLDLGCGRGEFVQLLSEHGISVTGIDSNLEMVESCRERGLKVIQADLFQHLQSQPDASLGGIFAAQVIEHFPPNRIMALIELAAQKLKPGGRFVAETINPNCPNALANFHLDPTHVRPVPFGLLQFMFEQAGFEAKDIRFSGPIEGAASTQPQHVSKSDEVDHTRYQDYAVIAARSAS